jgi:serine/threonine protein kinase
MDHIEEDKRVEVFKQEAACYQNVRHENLVFFCGYTLDPSKLGIVLERFRGPSLYTYLHESTTESAVDFNDAVDFAKQICQVFHLFHIETMRTLLNDSFRECPTFKPKTFFIKIYVQRMCSLKIERL